MAIRLEAIPSGLEAILEAIPIRLEPLRWLLDALTEQLEIRLSKSAAFIWHRSPNCLLFAQGPFHGPSLTLPQLGVASRCFCAYASLLLAVLFHLWRKVNRSQHDCCTLSRLS